MERARECMEGAGCMERAGECMECAGECIECAGECMERAGCAASISKNGPSITSFYSED
jgi:hypothetical protein